MNNDIKRLDWLNERYSKLSSLNLFDAFKVPYPKGRALRFGSIRKAIDYMMEQQLQPLGPVTYNLSDEGVNNE